MFDLAPAAHEMSRLVAGVQDDQLEQTTPCEKWTVADLLAHVHQFASVFTSNARKVEAVPPQSLPDDWRTTLPSQLDDLVAAWRDEDAWQGRVSAGGIEMDAADNAVVAVEECLVHGWDLARATGQELHVDVTSLDEVERFLVMFADAIDSGRGPYGPEVPAPRGADRLDRIIARAGRDPSWSSPPAQVR
jgi:uncharacterized protein (TIGR03086 family)